MKPPKSILDPDFRYTPSVQTDLRKTFARIRREQKAESERQIVSLQFKPLPIRKAR